MLAAVHGERLFGGRCGPLATAALGGVRGGGGAGRQRLPITSLLQHCRVPLIGIDLAEQRKFGIHANSALECGDSSPLLDTWEDDPSTTTIP